MIDQAEMRGRAAPCCGHPNIGAPADETADIWAIRARERLVTQLQDLIERHRRNGKLFSLLLLELRSEAPADIAQDRQLIAARLYSGVRRGDNLCWLSADRLAITLEGLASRPPVQQIGERLRYLLDIPGFQLSLTAFGSAHYPLDGVSATELLLQAEQASHRSRQSSHPGSAQPPRRASSTSQRP